MIQRVIEDEEVYSMVDTAMISLIAKCRKDESLRSILYGNSSLDDELSKYIQSIKQRRGNKSSVG